MKYRIDVLRNYVPIGELPVQACSVNYNAEAKIKRSASITCNMDMMRFLFRPLKPCRTGSRR